MKHYRLVTDFLLTCVSSIVSHSLTWTSTLAKKESDNYYEFEMFL
jgi:hypothetical protein